MMKSLLLVLLLRLLSLGAWAEGNCNELITDKTISLKGFEDVNTKEDFKIFSNNMNDDPYILYQFTRFIAIVSTKKGHIVTVNKRLDIKSEFYAFLNAQNDKEYLSIGVLNGNGWCRYDICTSCDVQDRKPIINPDTRPNVGFFSWSKSNSVAPGYITDDETTGIIAEYVSVGRPKIVLSCYENSLSLRTPIGHRITTINTRCSENFMQTLTIMTLKQNLSPQEIFQLGVEGEHQDLSWIYKNNDFGTVVSYFMAKHPSRNCYWKRIPNETPNTCPFLKMADMDQAHMDYINNLPKNTLTLVKVWMLPSNLVLECYKENGQRDSTFYSVFSEAGETHVVTIKMFDCSSAENFAKTLVVERINFGGENLVTIVGSRKSENDDWCSYSITQKRDSKGKAVLNRFNAWVYYDYKPKDGHWNEISSDNHWLLNEVSAKSIKASYNFQPGVQPVATYLLLRGQYGREDRTFLECYFKSGRHVGVIKTLNNRVIVSIPGLPCKSKSDLDIKSFVHFTEIDSVKYITIGSRETAKEHWHCYTFCAGCPIYEKKYRSYILGCNPDKKEIAKWSQNGVLWKRVGDTSYERTYISNYYSNYEDDSLTLIQLSHQDYILRNSVGTQFAVLDLKDGNSIKIYMVYFLEHTETQPRTWGEIWSGTPEKKNTYYVFIDDKYKNVKELTDENKKIWFFYYQFDESEDYSRYIYHDFKKVDSQLTKTCKATIEGNLSPDKLACRGTEEIYTTDSTPEVTLSCCTGTHRDTAVVKYNGNHLLTWTDYCSRKETIKNFYLILTTSGNKFDSLIIGTKTEDKMCWYNMFGTATKLITNLLIDYVPTVDPPHQWYEGDSNSCPFNTRNGIKIKPYSTPKSTQKTNVNIRTYLAKTEGLIAILECYENTSKRKYYSKEILLKTKYKELFYVETNNEFECDLERLHVSTSETLSYLSFAIQSGTRWCRYDACITCSTKNFRLNIDEDKPSEKTKWSEQGFKVTRRKRPECSDGDSFNFQNIDQKYFKKMFYSTDFPQRFLIRCYHKDNQYLTVILSARGIRIETLTGINCLQNQFYDFNFVIKNDKRLVISQEDIKFCTRENDKCWLYECNEEEDKNQKVMMFFFFAPEGPLGSLKDANGETQTMAGPGWRVVEFPFVPTQPEDQDKPSDDRTQNQGSAQVSEPHQKNIIKPNEIILEDFTSTGSWELVAKYEQINGLGFELLCLRSAENKYYSHVFKDNEYVLTIASHDCSPDPYRSPPRVTLDERDRKSGYDYVLVQSSDNAWYSVCRKCDTKVTYLSAYRPLKLYYWLQEPIMEGCPLKKENIYIGETKLVEVQKELVARYISEDGHYNLNCYKSGNTEHILDIRIIEQVIMSIKGLDCSEDVNSVLYFASSDATSYTIGASLRESYQNGRLWKLETPWCLYNVRFYSWSPVTTIEPRVYKKYLANIKWIKAPLNFALLVKREDVILEEDKITVQESDLKVTYLSQFTNSRLRDHYTVSCYKNENSEYISVIKQLGSFKLAVKGVDCSSLSSLQLGFFLSHQQEKMTIGFKRPEFPENTLWCLYDVNISPTKTKAVVPSSTKLDEIQRLIWFNPTEPTQKRENKNSEDDEVKASDYMALVDNTRELVLVAKYKPEMHATANSGLTLLCIRSKQNNYYFSLFDNENHLLTLNYHCSDVGNSLSPSKGLTIAVDKDDKTNGKEFVFVRINNNWFSVHKFSKAVIHLTSYSTGKDLTWKKEHIMEDCLFKADYIYGEEKELPVQRDQLVTRYISASELGRYSANCYKSEGNEHILVMRRKQEFIMSFKGIDCSYSTDKDPIFYFALSVADPFIYTVGKSFKESNQNGRLWQLDTPWCLYNVNVRYPSKIIIEPAFTNKYLTNLPWTEERDCAITRNRITRMNTPTTETSKVKYYNGRSKPFQLDCYYPQHNWPFAILSISGDVIKIDKLNCASVNKLDNIDNKLLADQDEDSKNIIIGSRRDSTTPWCYYVIPHEKSKDIVLGDDELNPSILLSRWYMGANGYYPVESRSCFTRGQPSCGMVDNTRILPSYSGEKITTSSEQVKKMEKQLVATYAFDVKKDIMTQTFIVQCYLKNNHKTKYIMTIAERKESIAKEGSQKLPLENKIVFLAAFDNFDCSQRDLDKRIYMFTFKDMSMHILTFTLKYTKTWCQYDICVENCPEPKPVLSKACDAVNPGAFGSFKMGFWMIENPSFKDQIPVENDPSYERKQIEVKSYLKQTLKPGREYFLLECYKFKKSKSATATFLATIKTSKGLILTTIENVDCIDRDVQTIGLNFVMVKKSDGSRVMIDLDFATPPERNQDSCWFYGCATADAEVMFFIEAPNIAKEHVTGFHKWRQILHVDDSCPKMYITENQDTRTPLQEDKLVAEYGFTPASKSGFNKMLTLKCYEWLSEKGGQFYLEVFDKENQNYLGIVQNIRCDSLRRLRYNFNIEKDKINEVELIIFKVKSGKPSCDDYSLIVCEYCQVKNWKYYQQTSVYNVLDDSQWEMLPTPSCKRFQEENIHLDNKVDDGFKKHNSLINDSKDDTSTYLMTCFKTADGRFTTRFETVNGRHVVSILSIDCSSSKTFNQLDLSEKTRRLYTSIQKHGQKTYLSFITQDETFTHTGNWCRYDVCVGCQEKEMISGIVDDHYEHVMEWSENGIDVLQNGMDVHVDFKTETQPLSERNMFSKHVNNENKGYGMECYHDESVLGKFTLTIVNGPNRNLFRVKRYDCDLLVKKVYVHIKYNDGSYNLIRLNEKQKIREETKVEQDKTVFVFEKELMSYQMDWKLVSELKLPMLDRMNFPPVEDPKECWPEAKQPTDLINW
ncbi:uncharacterized protein LOC128997245 isoform X2 [Macrosteles quadrilineatus]|uniref:uncharacterized protein LOC128997245 isoform X2 n=1 Tax=Macrosteles quadrilineatus TaxID=74068 RepID=UPI0023E3051A|nr:uncharacterized protein LOC128997245 isoform X2 [Macrosteles quadrilineatus]